MVKTLYNNYHNDNWNFINKFIYLMSLIYLTFLLVTNNVQKGDHVDARSAPASLPPTHPPVPKNSHALLPPLHTALNIDFFGVSADSSKKALS